MKSIKAKKTILFTGGGTAGHVIPNIALIKKFQRDNCDIHYIGSYDGIEKRLISKLKLPYHSIFTGKLRRYFSWQNFIDPFKISIGLYQALYYCFRIRPDCVFSKGGFVAFPVVVAAWLHRIPVIAHESDRSLALANRLSLPFVSKMCVAFKETAESLPAKKTIVTGNPVRPELLEGDKARGLAFSGFDDQKPVLLILGGGLGSVFINETIRKTLNKLLKTFNIIHLCGKNKVDPAFENKPGYRQFEYINKEMPDIFAASDIVISRAGANTLFELLALQKPHILIPLGRAASRGDQIDNAKHFVEQGLSEVLFEEDLTPEQLLTVANKVNDNKVQIQQRLAQHPLPDSLNMIFDVINEVLHTT